MTALKAIKEFSKKAAFVLAVGTCAAYGGIAGGEPNPTGATGVGDIIHGKQVINIPGCPAHPDWIVGTIAHLLINGQAPMLDRYGRPKEYYQRTIHSNCPNKQRFHDKALFARELSETWMLIKARLPRNVDGCRLSSTKMEQRRGRGIWRKLVYWGQEPLPRMYRA